MALTTDFDLAAAFRDARCGAGRRACVPPPRLRPDA